MGSWRILLLITLAVLVFVALAGYGDFRETARKLADFPLTHLFGALGLSAFNFGLRFCRWEYYLRVLKINISLPVSSLVFLSGLAMSITPAKSGELLKSYLLRDRGGIPVAASVPVVLMERFTDVISVVLLALIGLAYMPLPVMLLVAAVLGLCAAVLLVLRSRLIGWLFDLPILRRWRSQLRASQQGLGLLAGPVVMGVAVALAITAWCSEGLALWLILRGLDADVSLLRVLPIYAAASLLGGISAIPGGLVGTEGSMVALLQQSGLAKGVSSVATLLVRLVTLWFAIAVGLVALALLKKIRSARDTGASGEEYDSAAFENRA